MKSYKVETADLVEKVYSSIKEMILKGELVPGQKLIQEEMAAHLGVSRTPILSAFSKLEKEWLVKSIPRRGFYIYEMSREEKINLFDIRLRLESLGAFKAAELGTPKEKKALLSYVEKNSSKDFSTSSSGFNQHDYEFHRRITDMSRNVMLSTMISSYNIVSLSNQDDRTIDYSRSISDHLAISRAISESDAAKAEGLMRDHIQTGLDRIQGV
ncbi:GntR family transcriptional regulator [Spirochaeta isovalerica]|uniref:DNA-binding GntR family transcriptional regulator n=1 Tax=Spirochaeta isovalerica TaxID=150 RepID=A0A841R8U9_9SPIO|nr:GntR family transcriptional regulator [Spirochaeta isovalerica]MBB6479607.1 DNA-binding GntR family transcriptional regulator [Spirochaeta isovalerica]